MAWQHNSRHQQIETLKYFAKYDYSLTKKELEFWSGTKVKKLISNPRLEKIRRQREKYSLLKWGMAYRYGARLAKIPFIQAIFVTGSLAMNNCKKSDDIDFMIVTSPDTLWLTRFLVTLMFWKQKRKPFQKIAPDKICTNLWLESRKLKVESRSLYHAHEILQAKCIFDRGGIHKQFLKENSWVKEYLENAFKNLNYELRSTNYDKFIIHNSNFIIQILNKLLFVLQYLYMKPKMTGEKVGLGYAFFHPK